MKNVTICCEGPACNNGISAHDREAAFVAGLPRATVEMRDEAMRYARRTLSPQLAITEHVRCGVDLRGLALFACVPCGHERVYGSTLLEGYYE